jgi:hypothetical protein
VGGECFGADASLIKADASRYSNVDFAEWSAADAASRAAREYLDTLDDAAFGAATPVKPKAISPSDPAARLTSANGDRPFFAYSTNYLVDLDHAIIVDVEATAPIRQAETGAVRDMLVRTQDRFALHPDLLVADTGYGSADMLGWLVEEQDIEPHIPVFDKTERKDGAFPATDFVYDHEADEYRCPGGAGAETLMAEHLERPTRVRQGRFQEVLRPETGLRCLHAEAQMHAQPDDPEDLPIKA